MLRILHDTKYDFIRYWKKAAILTIAWIIIGLGFLAFHGVNYSIEFTGGTLVQLQFKHPPHVDDIRAVVDQAGFPNSEITKFGSDTEYRCARNLTPALRPRPVIVQRTSSKPHSSRA